MSRYDVDAIRNQVKKRLKSQRDPSEFRAPKADEGKTLKYRFYVLPPLQKGDVVAGGAVMEHDMDMFSIPNGAHYLENKRIGCPRIIHDEDCEICQYAFDLMAEIDAGSEDGKKKRSAIAKQLLPGTYHMVNLYFPAIDANPEDVRGKVMWFNAPKTVVDLWLECLYRTDDGGDAEEPLPYGVFFDEMNSYLFQLEIKKDGKWNSFKSSKFLVTPNIGARPIASDKDKKADAKRIKAILEKRIDLLSKVPDVDRAAITRIAANLSGGQTKGGGFDNDEEEPKKDKPKKSTKPPKEEEDPLEGEMAEEEAVEEVVEEKKTAPKTTKPPAKSTAKPTAKPKQPPKAEPEEVEGEEAVDETSESEAVEEESSELDDEVDRLLSELDGE